MGVHHPTLERQDMLLLLSLVASALAAPQMTYWNPYVVPHMYNQHPVVYAQHGVYPYAGYPTHYAAGYPVARNIWPLSLSNVKDSKASFETSTSTCVGTQGAIGSTACTVSGEVIFSQNGLKDVLCGNNGGLTMNLQGTGKKPATSTSFSSLQLLPALWQLPPAQKLLRSQPQWSVPTARLLWMGCMWDLWTPPPPP